MRCDVADPDLEAAQLILQMGILVIVDAKCLKAPTHTIRYGHLDRKTYDPLDRGVAA
jgi:hypothetical protein